MLDPATPSPAHQLVIVLGGVLVHIGGTLVAPLLNRVFDGVACGANASADGDIWIFGNSMVESALPHECPLPQDGDLLLVCFLGSLVGVTFGLMGNPVSCGSDGIHFGWYGNEEGIEPSDMRMLDTG